MDINNSTNFHLNVIALIIFFIFSGCAPNYCFKLNKFQYDSTFLIRDPGSCTHIIFLNKDGKGKIIRGRAFAEYTKEFKKFDDVEFVAFFEIGSKEALFEINGIIENISNSDLKSRSYLLDSRHKEFFIGKEKKYDIYGWKFNDLNKLLLKISPHLPYDLNSQCVTSSGIKISDKNSKYFSN